MEPMRLATMASADRAYRCLAGKQNAICISFIIIENNAFDFQKEKEKNGGSPFVIQSCCPFYPTKAKTCPSKIGSELEELKSRDHE